MVETEPEKQKRKKKREGFDIMSLVKNPMIIVLVVGFAIAFLAPKLIDTEALKEASETVKEGESAIRTAIQSSKNKQ